MNTHLRFVYLISTEALTAKLCLGTDDLGACTAVGMGRLGIEVPWVVKGRKVEGTTDRSVRVIRVVVHV
jgi:hypothetical protein